MERNRRISNKEPQKSEVRNPRSACGLPGTIWETIMKITSTVVATMFVCCAIQVAGPKLLRVHQKTGAIYVQHAARVEGGTVERLTKFVSFDNPVEEFHADGISSVTMAVDSWSAKARLWLGGEAGVAEAGVPCGGKRGNQ
ncbi:MAG: hypothetical protein C0404_08295 [Verrucomicrobia bacterium]|nr:hypothetical protein [Verrucomicrobiota bacterium]